MALIVLGDLPSGLDVDSAQLTIMLAGANAAAGRVAPCLVATGDDAPSADQLAEAKLVLLGAIIRWARAGSGGVQTLQQTAGVFGQMTTTDTTVRSGYKLWPSEITDLQAICKTGNTDKGAYAIDTAPSLCGQHAPWCNLYFGATYCSCGADIAGLPIYEVG